MYQETQDDILSEITDQENFGYTLASPLDRLGATFVEGIIIYIPLYFILGSNTLGNSDSTFDIETTLIRVAISVVMGAILYPMWSCNLGHRIFGMKVISALDGSDQRNAGIGALREGLKDVLGFFLIPSIWLLWDKKIKTYTIK